MKLDDFMKRQAQYVKGGFRDNGLRMALLKFLSSSFMQIPQSDVTGYFALDKGRFAFGPVPFGALVLKHTDDYFLFIDNAKPKRIHVKDMSLAHSGI